ncbi:hypothetical protein G3580_03880 [Nitrogeniibacter mangrovi]|uniref:Uncharacterized protein n=1 Tax=Nitrogeniibacter mangrovi TaxID=2016596 RepID=A0A6C1B1Z6_9RHOO|nr:hypothetical protein [Nitrogeniibacter mangrovi]QID16848.1 hypothetical protein G3580_03880 [Nitrogeniibacter mangrovi]
MDETERGARLLRFWPWVVRLAYGLAALNLVIALFVRTLGSRLDPAFADPHAWLLFVVTSASLAAQAFMMGYIQRVLRREQEPARHDAPRRRVRAQMSHPLQAGRHASRHHRMGSPTAFARIHPRFG